MSFQSLRNVLAENHIAVRPAIATSAMVSDAIALMKERNVVRSEQPGEAIVVHRDDRVDVALFHQGDRIGNRCGSGYHRLDRDVILGENAA